MSSRAEASSRLRRSGAANVVNPALSWRIASLALEGGWSSLEMERLWIVAP
jgi:hypothetical protein